MSESRPKLKWSDAEKQAVEKAYQTARTADEFFASLRADVPNAPNRSVKAYLTHLCRTHTDTDSRRTPVYLDLSRASAEEVARDAAGAAVTPPAAAEGKSWLDELDPTPVPPSQPPKPAPAPNFVKPAAKPDPNARVPRHIPTPPASKTMFTPQEAATALGVPLSVVKHAMSNNRIPHVETMMNGPFITRSVFDVLHSAQSEGHSFEHACILAMEKLPAPTPIVPAEKLYAHSVEEAPVEPDPNKVREGYIPNPFLKGPFPIEKKQEAPTLNDPNPDAKEAFTVEEAAKALGLSSADTVLTAIHRDGFPAVKIDGKWCLTRADLKRVLALRDSGFSVKEAFKRAGAPPVGEPTPTPDDTSWTAHLAPLTPEEEGLAAALPDVGDRDPVWEAVSLEDLANELGVLPPPPAEIHVPAMGGDERVWTLEAIRDGVFTVEQARDILGLKDAARTNWALGLLAAGKVTLDQAAKLLR
jgi:excisionase family DNA binding protein